MSDIRTWSKTASSNSEAPPNGFPEGMAYSAGNNAAREVMASLATWRDETNGSVATTGTADALFEPTLEDQILETLKRIEQLLAQRNEI